MQPAIQCRDLRKTYDGKVEAVRGLSLEIQTGECFGLLGPNGAGKTTTIEILEGLLAPTSGEVSILGHSWNKDERELREWLGISLQEARLSNSSPASTASRGRPTKSSKSFNSPKRRTLGSANFPEVSANGWPLRLL